MTRIAAPFALSTAGRLGLTVSDIRLAYVETAKSCGRP
jgi:hypothetical protein